MKYGYSQIAGCIMNASEIRHGDCAEAMIRCPKCDLPVFKVERNPEGATIHYLSHYQKSEDDKLCALRVDSMSQSEIERLNSQSRGQTLESYHAGLDEMIEVVLDKFDVSMDLVLELRRNPKVQAFAAVAEARYRREYDAEATNALLLYVDREATRIHGPDRSGNSVNERILASMTAMLASDKGRKGLNLLSTAAYAVRAFSPTMRGTPEKKRIQKLLSAVIDMSSTKLRRLVEHGGRRSDKPSEAKSMVKSVLSVMQVFLINFDYAKQLVRTVDRMPAIIGPMIAASVEGHQPALRATGAHEEGQPDTPPVGTEALDLPEGSQGEGNTVVLQQNAAAKGERAKNPKTILAEVMASNPRDYVKEREADPGYRAITAAMDLSAATGQPVTIRVALSPATSRWLLNRNTANRSFSETKAIQYSNDMSSSNWLENGDGLAIATTGDLNNGQHRLVAIIHSGATIMTNVTVGVSRASRATNDIGLARSLSAVLAMEGKENSSILGAMTRLILGWEDSKTANVRPARETSNLQIMNRIEHDPAIPQSAVFARSVKGKARNILSTAQIGFLHYVMRRHSPDNADAFMTAIATGVDQGRGMDANDPRFVARERLAKDFKILNNQQRVEIVFRAWNLWRSGKTIQKYMLTGTIPSLVR